MAVQKVENHVRSVACVVHMMQLVAQLYQLIQHRVKRITVITLQLTVIIKAVKSLILATHSKINIVNHQQPSLSTLRGGVGDI